MTEVVGEHPAIARVRAHAAANGVAIEVRRFPAGTRTAEDAARAIDCEVARIVKSLVFLADGVAVVALCSGADRVDERRLAAALGASHVRRATADEARAATGYVIGGVPPFAHATACAIVVDRRLLDLDLVWAAAGLPDAVFAIAPGDLVRLSGARPADLSLAHGSGSTAPSA